VNWIRNLFLRWDARNYLLVCPNCKTAASAEAFRRGRYMLGEQKLTCERCGEASLVTLWRFEGLSLRPTNSAHDAHWSAAN
jgi:hypothetical protein